jgi:hypothetical protein
MKSGFLLLEDAMVQEKPPHLSIFYRSSFDAKSLSMLMK